MSEFKSDYRKKLRELNDTKAIISTLAGELQRLYKKTIEFDLGVKHQEELEALQEKTTGLNIESIRNFLCADKDAASIGLKAVDIGIQGDGPWGELEFQDFLIKKGFSVTNITDQDVQYIILGSRNIDEDELNHQITTSIEGGFHLYIFTQELFLV